MTNAIALAPKDKALTIQRSLEGRRDQLLKMLGGDERLTDRFLTVALASIVKSNDLLDADPLSLLNSIRDAAQMGLEPAGPLGEGAIVAYKGIAQFQPMVRGLRKLAMQHPDVSVVNVGIRHEKDVFEYREGSDPFVYHEPYIADDDPGAVMGAYAYAKVNGEIVALYMNTAEIRKRQRVARTSKVWDAWPEEMMKKTVLRRLISEKLTLTTTLGLALSVDEADLDRPTVTSDPRLVAPGSRTRARLEPETDNPAPEPPAGQGEPSQALSGVCDADPPVDYTGGPCLKPTHGPDVTHKNEDGETWE